MELDELKALWTENNRKLENSLRLNALLLQQTNLHKAGNALRWLSAGIGLELAINLIGVMLIGVFAADHVREPAFLIPAIALGVYAIAIVAAGVRQIVDIASVDYDGPVVAIQLKLEQLRLRRIRTTMWTLLFAPLMWVPLLIVALRGFFGVNVYAGADPAWLVANALFGLAVIPIGIELAKRFGPRLQQFTAMRAVADAIAGRSLADALNELDSIRRFEAEA